MTSEPAPRNTRELPEPSVELMLIGSILKAAESRMPGFIDEITGCLEDDHIRAEIVRLRGPRTDKRVRDLMAQSVTWIVAARSVHALTREPPKRSWWDRRR